MTASFNGTHAFLQNFALDGQVALITGAARGLGWEIARAMASSGAHVILNGRDRAALQQAADTLRNAGLAASIAPFEVGDGKATQRAIDAIETVHGRLDILVNNVGARHRQRLHQFTDDAIRALIDSNLTGAILLAREATRLMLKRRHGRLIAITSIAGHVARPGDAIYTATKAGLTGLVRALAAEFGPHGITSNAIAPGGFATEANASMLSDPAARRHFEQRTPLGRWGNPGEIAGAAVFLASSAASYVNGHILVVDGGMTISM